MKHTKGEWKAAQINEHNEGIWNVFYDDINYSNEICTCYVNNTEANAKLIAAAPELLYACKKLIQHKNQGDLHPVDYQRINLAIQKATL